MSQIDLAEKMNVSRQSISKWETDTSIPDLDKLILLSEIFNVTIDELVKDGEVNSEQGKDEEAPVQPSGQTFSTQKIIGFIMLAVGLVGAILALAADIALAFPSAYLLFCGAICLAVKKHGGLLIAWITFLLVVFLTPRMTATNMNVVFIPYYYKEKMLLHLGVAYALWALLIVLAIVTARLFFRGHTLLVLGWLVFFQCWGFIPLAFRSEVPTSYRIASVAVNILLAALLFFTGKNVCRYVRERKNLRD